jgi:hypothetical protein
MQERPMLHIKKKAGVFDNMACQGEWKYKKRSVGTEFTEERCLPPHIIQFLRGMGSLTSRSCMATWPLLLVSMMSSCPLLMTKTRYQNQMVRMHEYRQNMMIIQEPGQGQLMITQMCT